MAGEKLFEGRVKAWLRSQGVYSAGTPMNRMEAAQRGWFFKVWGGGYQKAGIPDLIICLNGLFISVELKAGRGAVSELQRLNTARINASKGVGMILYPDGFEDFKSIVKGMMDCDFHLAALNALKAAHTSSSCAILTE
jgi:hypothetical protein